MSRLGGSEQAPCLRIWEFLPVDELGDKWHFSCFIKCLAIWNLSWPKFVVYSQPGVKSLDQGIEEAPSRRSGHSLSTWR